MLYHWLLYYLPPTFAGALVVLTYTAIIVASILLADSDDGVFRYME